MASNIDETKPQTGIDQPVDVIRTNFAQAKLEIEDLQSSKVDKNGDSMLGVLQLAPFAIANLTNPSLTPGGIIFITDAIGGPAVGFSDGTDWINLSGAAGSVAELNLIGDVNVGTPGAPQDGLVLAWNDAAGEFRLTSVSIGFDLGEFTVAGLPTASSNANRYALATDASGGRTIVRSDGTDWKVVIVEGATVVTI